MAVKKDRRKCMIPGWKAGGPNQIKGMTMKKKAVNYPGVKDYIT